MKLTCTECNNEYKRFGIKATKSKFCTRKCRFAKKENHNNWKNGAYKKKKYICSQCGIEFMKYEKNKFKNTFCSVACHNLFRKKKTVTRAFVLDPTQFKKEKQVNFILPRDAQKLIFGLGLKQFYYDKEFKKYSIKDFGENKFKNMIAFNVEFQEKLLGKKIQDYSKKYGKERMLTTITKSRFCFYDEDEIMEWVYQMRKSTF